MKDRIFKRVSILLSLIMLFEALAPTAAWALTTGPSQPEVQSFEPIGTTEMVNTFNGDFTYNIPLMELPGPYGGYPLNLHYNAGITPEQEASWVGLGWNLNVGAITRQKNGLPDEFSGEQVKTLTHMRPNKTIGVTYRQGMEIAGAEAPGKGIKVSPTVFYNNYNGLGYSVSFVKGGSFGKSSMSPDFNVGVTLNSQEGIDVNVDVSMDAKLTASRNATLGIGLGYNSEAGLKTLRLQTATSKNKTWKWKEATETYSGRNSRSSGGGFSLSDTHFSPVSAPSTKGSNVTIGLVLGKETWPSFKYYGGEAYVQKEEYVNNGKEVSEAGYGYNNLNAANNVSMLDVNREKDDILRKHSQFLGIPIATPDYYNVTANGMADQFRAFRNDYGKYSTSARDSRSYGIKIGLELSVNFPGPIPPAYMGGSLHVGADIALDQTKSYSGPWTNNDEFGQGFKSPALNTDDETVHFRSLKDHSADLTFDYEELSQAKPLRIPIEDAGLGEWKATDELQAGTYGSKFSTPSPDLSRKPRGNEIHYINNNPSNGFVITNPNGMRYVYGATRNGKPSKAMNTTEVSCTFSMNESHSGSATTSSPSLDLKDNYMNSGQQYCSKTTLPPYAHSFMLTEITGSDYVDVTGDGVSEDDYGYWVKFEYEKVSNYRWRAPYAGVNYIDGLHTTFDDNMGSYAYGEKEILYLKRIDTQTHFALFTLSSREDARGVKREMQNLIEHDDRQDQQCKKLDKITLYSKKAPSVPIKAVNFTFDYLLCKGNYNHQANNGKPVGSHSINGVGGKLTLTELSFTYENSERGALSPYKFFYSSASDPLSNVTTLEENPQYSQEDIDRWGNYYASGSAFKPLEPFTKQFDDITDPEAHREKLDQFAASWSLRAIKLPTGGVIKIEYEADDYAYVQNKRAMQMFQINSVNSSSSSTPGVNDWADFEHPRNSGNGKRKVYFKLEKPILDNSDANTVFKKQYLSGISNIYFKVYMKIRKAGQEYEDYVEGYNDIDIADCSVNTETNTKIEIAGKWYFTQGVLYLSKPTVGNSPAAKRDIPYHPFSVAAWNYIRTKNPKIMYPQVEAVDPDMSTSSVLSATNSLLSFTNMLANMAIGYYTNCHAQNFGESLQPSRSYVRLLSPDRVKVGGGHRVKKITINDNWGSTAEQSVYGLTYEYTTQDKNGDTISSGVAENEPSVGYDECALRRPYEFAEAIPLKLNQNYFTEAPINESYFPGANVGYSKVTIKSLVASESTPVNADVKLSSSGATVYEFYTCKDFPVIIDYTDIIRKPQKFKTIIPLFGTIDISNMTVSQGYMILLNDMNGRLKKMSEYQRLLTGEIDFSTPVSYEEYFYNSTIDRTGDYNILENKVPVLLSDSKGVANRQMAYVGQSVEFFTDFRESDMEYESISLGMNLDLKWIPVIIPPAPLPVPFPLMIGSVWPGFAYNKRRLRMAVTNKVIHRSGILTKVVSYHDGSSVVSENLLFDKISGEPLLTSQTNNFEDPVYSYNQPAYFVYDGMGPAYKNAGMRLEVSSAVVGGKCTVNLPSTAQYLVPGDELVNGSVKAYVESVSGTSVTFKTAASSLSGTFFIERSGRRNHLGVYASNISTLGQKGSSSLKKVMTTPEEEALVGDPTDNRNR